METKETLLRTEQRYIMLEDIEYYKYIFKKTEKIACAVFYILRSGSNQRQDDALVFDLESTANELLDTALESVSSDLEQSEEKGATLRYALLRMESKLRLAHGARLIGQEHLEVFLHEIDSVQRSLKKYIEPRTKNPLSAEHILGSSSPRERKVQRQSNAQLPREGGTLTDNKGSRRERIVQVLRDKGSATIKDIVEVVTDCSEKTIQRELISLIKDNIVSREGERRWSKYSLK